MNTKNITQAQEAMRARHPAPVINLSRKAVNKGLLEGAAREATVKADLMRRDFEVYGAECGSASFDLAAYKYGILIRVEVKGEGKAPRTSPVGSCSDNSRANSADCRKFDILAAVDGQNVRYVRSLLCEPNAVTQELVGTESVNPKTPKKHLARAARLNHCRAGVKGMWSEVRSRGY
jgi:hypothetical protein